MKKKLFKKVGPEKGDTLLVIKNGDPHDCYTYRVSKVENAGKLINVQLTPDLFPEATPLFVRRKIADEIVDIIRPQIQQTVAHAVATSLSKEYPKEKLEDIKQKVVDKPESVSLYGKKGCMFLKVSDKKYKL
jgi:hypothetical protein